MVVTITVILAAWLVGFIVAIVLMNRPDNRMQPIVHSPFDNLPEGDPNP